MRIVVDRWVPYITTYHLNYHPAGVPPKFSWRASRDDFDESDPAYKEIKERSDALFQLADRVLQVAEAAGMHLDVAPYGLQVTVLWANQCEPKHDLVLDILQQVAQAKERSVYYCAQMTIGSFFANPLTWGWAKCLRLWLAQPETTSP